MFDIADLAISILNLVQIIKNHVSCLVDIILLGLLGSIFFITNCHGQKSKTGQLVLLLWILMPVLKIIGKSD